MLLLVAIGCFGVGVQVFRYEIKDDTPNLSNFILSAGFFTGGFLLVWKVFVRKPTFMMNTTEGALSVVVPYFLFIAVAVTLGNKLATNYQKRAEQKQ